MNDVISGIHEFNRIVPPGLRKRYWRVRRYVDRLYTHRSRVREIDLRRTLVGGEGTYNAVAWAQLTCDWARVSTLLEDSIYVKFLEHYRRVGEKILNRGVFEETGYYKNALRCVEFWGDYFGQTTTEGIRAQARAFIRLYERIKNRDTREITFPSDKDHALPQSAPLVRETLTRNTYQIVDGHHRLAIAWALGHGKASAVVLASPFPSGLQSLVLRLAEERKELYQPIDGPEFDDSWRVRRPCHGQFETMVDFLTSRNYHLNELSVVDLACSYGWFVNEFSKKGCDSLGVETNPTALNIGRIAYGLRADQLVEGDSQAYLQNCNRMFDVVLFFDVLRDETVRHAVGTLEEMFRRIDAITGSVLFFDIEQTPKRGWRNSLPERVGESILKLIKENTSFAQVLRLERDSDGARCENWPLFACFRF